MKARVSQLHKTEAEWTKLSNFIPLAGEIIIFDADKNHNYVRLKIGDGIQRSDGTINGTRLKDLPFFIDSTIDDHVTKKRLNEVIDAGRVTDYKK
jgi:hypothetical protein